MQNYTFLSKHRLFQFLLGVFYEAIPAVRCIFCGLVKKKRDHKKMPLPSGLKKIRQEDLTEIFIHLFILNYNSNNKVKETLFSFDVMLAPSVNPVAKNP